jgi:hypothetical protein
MICAWCGENITTPITENNTFPVTFSKGEFIFSTLVFCTHEHVYEYLFENHATQPYLLTIMGLYDTLRNQSPPELIGPNPPHNRCQLCHGPSSESPFCSEGCWTRSMKQKRFSQANVWRTYMDTTKLRDMKPIPEKLQDHHHKVRPDLLSREDYDHTNVQVDSGLGPEFSVETILDKNR